MEILANKVNIKNEYNERFVKKLISKKLVKNIVASKLTMCIPKGEKEYRDSNVPIMTENIKVGLEPSNIKEQTKKTIVKSTLASRPGKPFTKESCKTTNSVIINRYSTIFLAIKITELRPKQLLDHLDFQADLWSLIAINHYFLYLPQ